MKIICENCGAKYSIADEKVKGKVFKIRCKKCSESILVRGDVREPAHAPTPQFQPAVAQQPVMDDESDVETRVFDYSGHQGADGGAIWHIVIDDDQQGPYPSSQVVELLKSGAIGSDSLVWREGFDDWMPVGETAEFVQYASASSPARAEMSARGDLFNEGPGLGAPGKLFDEQPSGGLFGGKLDADTSSPFEAGGGLFGDNAGSALGGDEVFSSTNPGVGGGGLFADGGGGDGGAAVGGGDLFAHTQTTVDIGNEGIFSATKEPEAAPSPRVSAERAMMTGQRSENSVLFSLANLQALAATPSPPKEQHPTGFDMSGLGGGGGAPMVGGRDEASGLIDIRSLAGSLSTAEQDNSVDDLISMSSGGFSPALGAPILAAQNEGMSSGMKWGIIGGGVGFMAIIVVVLVVALSGSDEEKAANAQIEALTRQIQELTKNNSDGANEAAIAKLKAQIEEKRQAEAQVADSPSEQKGAKSSVESAGSASKKKGTAVASSSSSSSRTSSRKTGSTKSSSKSDNDEGASSREASSPPPQKSGGRGGVVSELDDLLGGGAQKKKASPSPSPSSGSSSSGGAKSSLSRTDVQRGMSAVAPAVKRCGQGQGGTITMAITIGTTGRVSNASATGAFAGTPIGSCAARAVRRAKFPASQQTLNVKYPFKL
jgi:predicted Zn finger-like uncharacterized protein